MNPIVCSGRSSCLFWKTDLPKQSVIQADTFESQDTVFATRSSSVFNLDNKLWQITLIGNWNAKRGCERWELYLKVLDSQETRRVSLYIEKKMGDFEYFSRGEITFRPSKGALVMHLNELDFPTYGFANDVISMCFVLDMDSKLLETWISKQLNDIPKEAYVTNSEEIEEKLPDDSSLLRLSEDMEKLFDKEEHSDAVLRCGDRSFSVNKKILSARSDVFAAMFRNEMSESETGVANIVDIESPVLEQFLRYVYSGRIEELNMDTAFDLYKASDKYAVDSLKQKCSSFMLRGLSEDNVCNILLLANTFGDSALLKYVISFVVKRANFLRSTQWIEFAKKNPSLAVEVFIKSQEK